MPIQWYEVGGKEPYKTAFDFKPKNQKYKYAEMGMHKVWSGVPTVNGEITHQISPYRLKIVTPMLQKGGRNILSTLRYNLPFVGPPFAVGYFCYWYGHTKFAENALHHRD
mmetsp:Transcript_23592/g.35339  ORF Transcript_23592/g.35339 Transcript_23592/m.35339 type:complete len:110 (+) Transcript_23592:89-418(+)|eukprot:CAMPEP_0167749300 /NCGR_PEP_ID=MMETSP0110_2-20121227/5326_1 /TAXON_ID=629695 /ORGANISM="Gymnochlora sp., Strain CCMP2014" /LENGTH=109 /DNA_ID=CAMNT_0007634429 /DNA_START=93 /DNA_END=422 /DNA_ORIENTATION=+